MMSPHPILDHDPAFAEYRRLSETEFAALAQNAGEQAALAYVAAREQRIKLAETDPLRFGFELPHWRDVRHVIAQKAETYVLGANDSGKTELGGKLAVEVLTGRLQWEGMMPGAPRVMLISQNEDASIEFQQPAVYKYLPASARQFNAQGIKKRQVTTKINYSVDGGFTNGSFVLPNGARCVFRNVEQYQRNENSFEGPAYHLVIIDEPVPIALLKTVAFRAAKKGGKVVLFFTAVHGFDAVCASALTGARLVKSLPMNWDWCYKAGSRSNGLGGPNPEIAFPELSLKEVQVEGCPAGHMPYIMQPLDHNKGVIFTWAHWNPFPPRAAFNKFLTQTADKCVGGGKIKARIRLFGWAEKITGCQFPLFKTSIHVLPHEKIAEMLQAEKLTSYMSNDPRPARSHFLLWAGVNRDGKMFVFDESPRHEEFEWATDDAEKGEGATAYAGAGVNWYKKHIREREREHGVEAMRRFGDPRAFSTETATAEGAKNYLQLFADDHSAQDPDCGPMIFEQAKVKARIALDIEVINAPLAYDPRKELSVENEPKLYISDRCRNLIRSILNWSPDQGEDSPWKDPIDAFRYLFGVPLYYQDPKVPDVVGGRGWG